MERFCPICLRALTESHKISYIDYHCHPPVKGHHYAERIKDDQTLRMKIRLTEEGSGPDLPHMYLHIHYDDGYSEIWTNPGQTDRIRIHHIFVPDFTNLNALKSKLQTYIIFS
jgi:hypothetical protein